MAKIKNYNDLLTKVESVVKQKDLDLSAGEDLSIGIMNLISIEEHLFFSAQKTKDKKYVDLLNEVRKMRTGLLKEIIKDYAGEEWCISKHLLAASMRLMEVGTKELKKGDKKKANEFFDKAYKLYSLFWGINLNAIDLPKGKKVNEDKVALVDEEGNEKEEVSLFDKLGNMVQKALDCCRE